MSVSTDRVLTTTGPGGFMAFSIAAKAKRHRASLIWGIIVIAVWWFASSGLSSIALNSYPPESRDANRMTAFLMTQVFTGILFIAAAVLLIIGIVGEVKAVRFNRKDVALATAMNEQLGVLSAMPRHAMYGVSTGENSDGTWDCGVSGAVPLEVERHFDQQTLGSITGALQSRMNFFGASVGIGGVTRGGLGIGGALTAGRIHGTTQANLAVNETTRANLMGDGLFSTYEVAGDTWRLIAMPNIAAREWAHNLLLQLWHHFGSDSTHTGQTIGRWVGTIAQNFNPSDVSYATDRLKQIVSRPFDARPEVAFSGTVVGRNAILASELTLPDGTRLELLPVKLPDHVARAVRSAEHEASAQLSQSHNTGKALDAQPER